MFNTYMESRDEVLASIERNTFRLLTILARLEDSILILEPLAIELSVDIDAFKHENGV